MGDDIERIENVRSLPPRLREGHKGDYGRVLLVGGSRGMIGAVALASNAALRGGAGLVTFAAPAPIQLAIATLCPCATSVPLTCDAGGEMMAETVAEMLREVELSDVLAVGPGMGVGRRQEDLVRAAIQQDKPLVLDADGLNNLARIGGWASSRRCPLVLTPHPGEFSRLTGRSVGDIQSDRQSAATAAAAQWRGEGGEDAGPLVLVLKGAGTVVTDARRVRINETGNPGMATGGSGDVLTGLTAAMLAQGLKPFDAAALAVRLHGRAGDLAAHALSQPALIASDLLDYIPAAMKEISA